MFIWFCLSERPVRWAPIGSVARVFLSAVKKGQGWKGTALKGFLRTDLDSLTAGGLKPLAEPIKIVRVFQPATPGRSFMSRKAMAAIAIGFIGIVSGGLFFLRSSRLSNAQR